MMKFKLLAVTVGMAASVPAAAVDMSELTGDTKLACEAILCLSTGNRPSECRPSIKKYFSIHKRKWHDTVRARMNFLNLCPNNEVSSDVKEILANLGEDIEESIKETGNLKNIIAELPYDCTPESLNQQIQVRNDCTDCTPEYRIKPTLPAQCTALADHRFTIVELPVYVEDGHYHQELRSPAWIYKADVPAYQAQKAKEREEAQRQSRRHIFSYEPDNN